MLLKKVPFGEGETQTLTVERDPYVEAYAARLDKAGFDVEVCLIEDVVTISIKHRLGRYEMAHGAAPNDERFLQALDDTISRYAQTLKRA